MDERIESFLTNVPALEHEDSNAIREGVRIALADYEHARSLQQSPIGYSLQSNRAC